MSLMVKVVVGANLDRSSVFKEQGDDYNGGLVPKEVLCAKNVDGILTEMNVMLLNYTAGG
jgi:hypothetical protein